MPTRFLFINAIDYTRRGETNCAPLGLGYLASALRDAFGRDHFEFKVADRDIERTINEFSPDIVAITSVSANFNRAMAYARITKQYGLSVIIGGAHISGLPSSLTSDMDVGILGEGERTIVDLLTVFESESYLPSDSLQDVQGIVYHNKVGLMTNSPGPPISPLDQISMPARDLLNSPYVSVITSRGCPYRCIFCSAACTWGKVRFFSPEYVVNELNHIIENYEIPDRWVILWDELFIANTQRLQKIVDLMEKRGLPGNLRFWCHARSNLVTDEVGQLLDRMGVRAVSMGIESASPVILDYYKGSSVTVSDNRNAITTLRKHHIKPEASFILGAPMESRADFLKTYHFMKEFKIKADLYLLTPYPGTPLWDTAYQRGLVSEQMDWSVLKTDRIVTGEGSRTELENCWKNAVILSEKLTRKELFDLHRMFMKGKKQVERKKELILALKHPLWAFHVYPKRIIARIFRTLSIIER
jgi:anaerobic magnesium-protoporphyrin IX monomethyl ester cyclase